MKLQVLAGPLLVLLWITIAWPTTASAADPPKPQPQSAQQERWEGMYRDGRKAPWDIGRPSADLKQAVENGTLRPGRVVELGCGTGNDAIYLAGRGFDVTAIDIAPNALSQAEKKAKDAGVKVRWLHADVLDPPQLEPFDLIFDRGCYLGGRRGGGGRPMKQPATAEAGLAKITADGGTDSTAPSPDARSRSSRPPADECATALQATAPRTSGQPSARFPA